ncbi:hypothetical protein BC643_2136 [Mangrovibacterium diazotrophicum]|uniref:Uncharacterized protein n=1 Tax=Mangrovibacterium diazotrophicum TaxID=1261403 RepID=A0A419W8G8_9BACT|nr:hypothetical protein BC643_2136 [Mangrovibacterium diazotrophicum]
MDKIDESKLRKVFNLRHDPDSPEEALKIINFPILLFQ